MRAFRAILWVLLVGAGFPAAEAAALNITPDFSGLGTVRLDANGFIVTSGGTDVTDEFKATVNTAVAYWESAITKDWNTTITFQLKADTSCGTLGSSDWVGCAFATTEAGSAPEHITAGTIWFNSTASVIDYFVDSTPGADSEFSIASSTANLGGGTVNNKRRGSATGGGGAAGLWDLLTLTLHEIEHVIGFAPGSTLYDAAVVSSNITIDSAMSGLSSDFDVPVTGGHIDADADATFQHTVVAAGAGEWLDGERAKLTGVDILAVCQINQCTSTEYNLNPVPEPATGAMVALGVVALGLTRRSSRRGGRDC